MGGGLVEVCKTITLSSTRVSRTCCVLRARKRIRFGTRDVESVYFSSMYAHVCVHLARARYIYTNKLLYTIRVNMYPRVYTLIHIRRLWRFIRACEYLLVKRTYASVKLPYMLRIRIWLLRVCQYHHRILVRVHTYASTYTRRAWESILLLCSSSVTEPVIFSQMLLSNFIQNIISAKHIRVQIFFILEIKDTCTHVEKNLHYMMREYFFFFFKE